jgi:hypothetical protein
MQDEDGYDAADNSAKCYAEAIKAIRLQRIREGLSAPRPDHEDEMQAYREGLLPCFTR